MKLFRLVWQELRLRPTAMVTSLLAVTLGVTALVAVQNIAVFSERAIAHKMETLGANVLVLPPTVSLQDYYAADMHGQTMPEENVTQLALAKLPGVQNLAPKLCVPATVKSVPIKLTGILPRSEFQSKAAWQSVSLLSNPVGSDRGCCDTSISDTSSDDPADLATLRTIQELGKHQLVVGADLADRLAMQVGDRVAVLGESFYVLTVLPSTGTIDDDRLFAHLHTVQRLSESGEVVSVIEIMGCCEDAATSLVADLTSVLPGTKVVTISQVVETQVAVNGLMSRMSWVFFAILLLVGASSIASVMYANVAERRREIGTLMALGATPGYVIRMFLGKATLLGVFGGAGGFILGTVVAAVVGPQLLDVIVRPMPQLFAVGLGTAILVAVGASYLPARRASRLDPCLCFGDA